ncbi:MAG: hypothetical protein JXR63_03425 [Spirochaetales bacterium]|nr:hypothetical protein [Spirochaetales bacterium]
MKKFIMILSVLFFSCLSDNEDATSSKFRVTQLAMTVADIDKSMDFYKEIFSFEFAGRKSLKGNLAASIQGLDDVDATYGWLVDDSDFFQLEFFQYSKPVSSSDYESSNFPFFVVGVSDLNVVKDALKEFSIDWTVSDFLNWEEFGEMLCFFDLDGVEVRVCENISSDDFLARFIGAGVNVSSIDDSYEFFSSILSWGSERSLDSKITLDDSFGHKIELISSDKIYNHNIYDLGISHLCFGSRDRKSFLDLDSHLREQGRVANSKAMDVLFGGSVYYKPFVEFSTVVELMYLKEWADKSAGFKPLN